MNTFLKDFKDNIDAGLSPTTAMGRAVGKYGQEKYGFKAEAAINNPADAFQTGDTGT